MRAWLIALLAASSTLLSGSPAAHASPPAAADGFRPPFCTLNAGRTTLTVRSGDLNRAVLVYLPARSRGRANLPMVLDLHGSQSTAAEQLTRSGLDATADAAGFLVVAPQGIIDAPPGYRWNVPYVTGTGGPDDEQFLTDTITTLARMGCGDPGRVLAAGYSGGARMVSQYACDHPDRVTALAAVVGLRAGAPRQEADGSFVPDTATCQPDRPVPVMSFSGTADPVNPYPGGGAPYWGYGAEAAAKQWATLNGCRRGPRTITVSEHVSRVHYTSCRGGADVVSYVVQDGGHTWPGSPAIWPPALGAVTQEIDANEIMWRFLRTHTRRTP
ncbi:alpha/beta hydrolase family esterase [Nonomuraea sp. NPDC049480]|uniref:alpha/beta hydrolase family esterase n=1 Tax=Nonomuraea sp. NPDC049480 TaxID=3364353 RepID=UPI00379B24EE